MKKPSFYKLNEYKEKVHLSLNQGEIEALKTWIKEKYKI